MFDSLGKRLQALFLFLIIGLLIVVMGVFGFGNPNQGCTPQGAGYAAVVYGTTITEGDFRAAYTAAGFSEQQVADQERQNLRHYMLEGLIERELLAHEAERMGFTVDRDQVMRKVAEDEVLLMTGPVDAPSNFPHGRLQYSFRDRDGNFSADYLRRFIQYRLRRSVDEFVDWQAKETLAQHVRETVVAPVTVSPREIWDAYVQETERASISYVRFDPANYRDQVRVTDEGVTEWMGAHQDEVDQAYRQQRHRYTNLEEQARIRQILVRLASDATDEQRTAARSRAEGLLQRAQAGEDFADLARQNSDDEATASHGGDTGWFARGSRVAAVVDAAFSHQANEVHGEIVETQFGFYVIQVTGRRSGDVPEAEAKREIAEGLYEEARAGELAHEEANRALAYLREGHTTDELNEQLRTNWQAPAAPAEGETPEGEAPEGEAPEAPEREHAPQVSHTSFGRAQRALPGAFDSTPLTEKAFSMSTDEPLPEEPLQLGTSWIVFHLDERTEATQEGFTDEVRQRNDERLLTQKRLEVLNAYVNGLRARAESDGAIRRNPEILRYTNEEGDEEESGGGDEEQASL